jgi:putative FmdB family regulatory protein
MPIFEYRCGGCAVEFELLVRPSTVLACPECQSQELDKLLSVPAVRSGHAHHALPLASDCPPPEAGPCRPGCCRI